MPEQMPEFNTLLMESTFKVQGRKDNGDDAIGTCFILVKPETKDPTTADLVLVTARHVLGDIAEDTATLTLRTKGSDGGFSPLPHRIKIRDHRKPLWTEHQDKQLDIAVMYVSVPSQAYIAPVPVSLLATDADLKKIEIHPGDQLSCLGYPLGAASNDAFLPVLRSGKIASYPILPTSKTKTMLYDFSVYEGNSGGPVYLVESHTNPNK
jgi:S1-C subfamily serine protease